ncbi:MAG: hypothetical protein AAF329_13635 [Cyanobacteria bacterium P01_A01_bin.17]
MENQLISREVFIPEESDLTGLGADLRFYDAEGSQKEAKEFYPGIAVAADGFVPVAYCTEGSGDPYFINSHDGIDGPLYRIYHDAVSQESYNRAEAVAIVLQTYTDVLRFINGR